MGPGVAPDVDVQDVDAVGCDRSRGLQAYCRIAWIDLRVFVHPMGEVDDASHPQGTALLPRFTIRLTDRVAPGYPVDCKKS
jgi:hypothetical protein